MQEKVILLMNNLAHNDSMQIFKMYDTSREKMSNYYVRKEIKEEIRKYCLLYNRIIAKYGIPDKLEFSYTKDAYEANVIKVLLVKAKDDASNLEKCELIVRFYPDKFYYHGFNKILSFYIYEKKIHTTPVSDKIKDLP